jgi:hypothetical protein
MPVVVVDEPPGAELMPAEPGFGGAAGFGGAPTGGFVPTPGAFPVAAPAPAPCASTDAGAPISEIATSAERYVLFSMMELQVYLAATVSTFAESRRSCGDHQSRITFAAR